MSLPSYTQSLLAVALALILLIILYLLRERWRSQPDGLQRFLRRHPQILSPQNRELVMPLLVIEERYPAFGLILALVLERFPLDLFMEDEEFSNSLRFLNRAVYDETDQRALITAMGVIVRTFVSDPEVQYRCRDRLDHLLREFLREVEQRRSTSNQAA